MLLSFKKAYKPDAIFPMETKASRVRMDFVRVKLGFNSKLVVESSGSSGGICLFWMDSVDISLLSYSRFHIDVQVVSYRDVVWRCTGFYENPIASQRHNGWTLFSRLKNTYTLPWACASDFNEILDHSEKVGGGCRAQSLIDDFRIYIILLSM